MISGLDYIVRLKAVIALIAKSVPVCGDAEEKKRLTRNMRFEAPQEQLAM